VFVLDSAVSIRLVMLAFLLVVFDFDMKFSTSRWFLAPGTVVGWLNWLL
jgi:hypothetical protein